MCPTQQVSEVNHSAHALNQPYTHFLIIHNQEEY